MEQVTDGHATSGAPSKMLYHRAVYGQEEMIQPKLATAHEQIYSVATIMVIVKSQEEVYSPEP